MEIKNIGEKKKIEKIKIIETSINKINLLLLNKYSKSSV